LIRIACHELESWYLGDPAALQRAFPKFKAEAVAGKAKFRDVDSLANAAEELTKLVPDYQKVSGSRILGGLMSPHHNASHSFQVFCSGIKTLLR
jgi:hypothetical protein